MTMAAVEQGPEQQESLDALSKLKEFGEELLEALKGASSEDLANVATLLSDAKQRVETHASAKKFLRQFGDQEGITKEELQETGFVSPDGNNVTLNEADALKFILSFSNARSSVELGLPEFAIVDVPKGKPLNGIVLRIGDKEHIVDHYSNSVSKKEYTKHCTYVDETANGKVVLVKTPDGESANKLVIATSVIGAVDASAQRRRLGGW